MATKAKAATSRNWKRIGTLGLRLAVPTLLGALLVYGVLRGAGTLLDSDFFQLRAIHYTGVRNLDTEALDELIWKNFEGNLVWLDLVAVRELVESENWVETATVRRRLPDRLGIHVRERTPVAVAAIEGELKIVDSHGRVLDSHAPRYRELDGPIVVGLRNTALENAQEENAVRMRVYLELLTQLNAADAAWSAQLSEIDVADPNHVAVIPIRPAIPVFLGAEEFARRYQTFRSQLPLLERLERQHGTIESVDVTLDDRIIVHTPEAGQPQPKAS